MTLNDLIKYENALLVLDKRYKLNEITLDFNILVLLKTELENIGKITNIYIEELERLKDNENIEAEREKMLFTEVKYDIKNILEIISSRQVKDFCTKNA